MKLNNNVSALSEDEFGKLAAAVFGRIEKEGGWLPKEAYFAKVRAFPTLFTEIVCVCQGKDGEMEILLEKRPLDDSYWPGQYCTQGITVMPRQTILGVAKNHAGKECGIPIVPGEELEFAGCAHMPRTKREHALSMIFIRRLHKKPEKFSGEWHPLGKLPGNFIAHMTKSVIPVVRFYLSTGIPAFEEYRGK